MSLRSLLITLAAISPLAHAGVVDLTWDDKGRFEYSESVAPGKFVEVCGKLAKGQSVAWSFKSEQPMDFNVHYHEGKKVVLPVKQDGVAALEGKLDVPIDQDYCWMWSNKTGKAAALSVALARP